MAQAPQANLELVTFHHSDLITTLTNFAELNQAMRFQRSSTPDKQKVQHVSSKAVNNDENSGVFSLASTASNLHDISAYSSWVVEHPSALGSFDKMMKAAKGMRIVVFLDYDGTLSPIVDDPDLAFISNEMRAALREVVTYFPTAVISGRSRDKVKGFVQLSNIYYAGSHGMDIMVPKASELDESDMLFQPAKIFLPAIQEMRIVVEDIVRKIEGARVEENRFCISVHYRNIVREEDYVILEEKVKSVIERFPEFHLTGGKKVLEIRPSIEWNKGHALEYLLDTLGFSDSGDDVFPLYIGDDRTDEDAFKVIETRGQGFPIIVSSTPKEHQSYLFSARPIGSVDFLVTPCKVEKSLVLIWGLGGSLVISLICYSLPRVELQRFEIACCVFG